MSHELDLLRVDQVGSLLRPQSLKDVFARHGRGEVTDEDLRQAEDEAIRHIVRQQEEHNLPVVTDGEFRRLNFQDSFANSVAGFDAAPNTAQQTEQRAAGGQALRRWEVPKLGSEAAILHRRPVTERLRLARNAPLEEFTFLRSLTAQPAKITFIGPDRIAQRFDWERSRAVYDGLDAFVSDLVRVQREIVSTLVNAGCHYVQVDEPSYTAYVDPPSLAQMRSRGEDPEANMERAIAADNAIIEDFPEVTFGVHLCRGNQRSMWHREGSYDAIAERLFSGLNHQRFLLEYDDGRAGGFEPLRFVPKGKVAVLGLITTKTPRGETADDLKRRIDEAASYLPLEQLALSPQCGFASDIVGNLISEDDQWRKLDLMLETARQVWGSEAPR